MTAPFLISADSHVLEPPDIWTSRLPAKFQDRAPRQVRTEQGDTWQFPNSPAWPYGLNQCGGLSPEKYSPWVKWENVRPEAIDQLLNMGVHGIDISQGVVFRGVHYIMLEQAIFC